MELETIYTFCEKNPNIKPNTVRQWIRNGMRVVGKKPLMFKTEWVDEFLEEYSIQSRLERLDRSKRTHQKNLCKALIKHYSQIDEDFIYGNKKDVAKSK